MISVRCTDAWNNMQILQLSQRGLMVSETLYGGKKDCELMKMRLTNLNHHYNSGFKCQ